MTESILVTGSSRGIGRAIALRLTRAGYDIVLHCRSGRTEAQAVQAETQALGRQAVLLQVVEQSRIVVWLQGYTPLTPPCASPAPRMPWP